MTAAAKAAQRKRRKAGLEEVRALVNMPKFISWLVWDGWIREEDSGKSDAIRRALEDFLREQYEHATTDHPAPLYAQGSFGSEYVALRDRPKELVGLLQRSGEFDWRKPPTAYLITKRNAALRVAVPPPESPCEPADHPPGALMFGEDYLPPTDDYDPDADVEESCAELSDDALADCFDVEGYEKD
jgi:hypothetical protein